MNERYKRSIGTLTHAEQELLQARRAAVAGCGGLGCYAAELLARLGVGHITVIDGDVFAASNLNRQLYALETNLGASKAAQARERLLQINSGLSVNAFDVFLDKRNAGGLLKGHDVIIDALDTIKARLCVEKAASDLGIPLVHGAVEGWNAQVCTVFPGDFSLAMLYAAKREKAAPSVVSVTPALCASLQAAEAVKVLLHKEAALRKKLLTACLQTMSFDIIDLPPGMTDFQYAP